MLAETCSIIWSTDYAGSYPGSHHAGLRQLKAVPIAAEEPPGEARPGISAVVITMSAPSDSTCSPAAA